MGEFWKGLYGMTDAERSIEPAVASLGVPYRTQFPCFLFDTGSARKFFPDFLMPTIGVVLEVDDDGHNDPEKQKADAQRTSALEKLGYLVVRCTNEEALNDPHGTVKRLITPHLDRLGPGLPPPAEFLLKRKNKLYARTRNRSPRSPGRRGKSSKGQGVLR